MRPGGQDEPFRLDEATIEELHAAIQAGRTTCVAVVQHYIERVRAYNGVASLLVTEDGAPVPEAMGAVRATVPLRFPTETVKSSTVLPDLDKYKGPALEYGRMEATASDPGVQQQFGMIVGKPNAGQVNALATLNIRGERSVTCRGDFDRHPSAGPLPHGAAPVCEMFRRLPDALERAAELDELYGFDHTGLDVRGLTRAAWESPRRSGAPGRQHHHPAAHQDPPAFGPLPANGRDVLPVTGTGRCA